MLEEYLYEIIALIFIATLIIIYLLTLKFKKDEEEILQSIRQTEKKVVQNIQIDSQAEKLYAQSNNESFEPEPIDNEIKPTVNHRQKVEVPPHEKIVKNDFQEFSGTKILVAEDNVINQKVIAGLLAGSGIEITMADDGQIALDILKENSDFNIILMDAHMPRIDGFQATRIIRSNPDYEHIVIVALSGDIALDDVRKMKKAGMEEHLEKPLRMDDLYDILYAYTKIPKIIEEKPLELISDSLIKELNEEQGLLVCGGDHEFYKDILNEFIQDYSLSAHKLQDFIHQTDFKSADSLLLDFIGITANIGAENIRTIALELKEALLGQDEASYTSLLKKYTQHLELLIHETREYTH